MTDSLQPLIDQAEALLVLVDPVTGDDCDRAALDVTGDPDLFTTAQLATHLKRRWVIDLPPDWYPRVLDVDGEIDTPQPELLHRRDGAAMLYLGMVHILFGEPESGKTWIALQALAEERARGRTVVYIDFEMSPMAVKARLQAIGVTNAPRYLNPSSPLSSEGWQQLGIWMASEEVSLVVIDGVTEAMSLHGWDPNSNKDAADWGACLKTLAKSGAAVVAIDHVTKSKESRGRGPIGAQHKLAGADVALEVRVKDQPDPNRPGKLQVFVRKDRQGGLRAQANAAGLLTIVEMTPDDPMLLVEFAEPPEGHATSSSDWKPTYYMEKVSDCVRDNDGDGKPPSRNQIEKAVSGKGEYVRTAIDELVAGGYLEEIRDGNARRYAFIKSFVEGDEA